ncbi:2-polyprenyl-6-methoxyphenol hydroxylase [Streptomyces griseocarneus]|nr:2-polyprenyl-6-methoxyphenol hydroxylase [Streptomyces griseocarneus]
MSVSDAQDAVIIGAGPTGLALAIALRQYGLGVTVVEKEPRTKREARASVVWQRALEVLRDLGCAHTFLANGIQLNRAEMYLRGRRMGEHRVRPSGTPYPRPLSIEQDSMEPLLVERLRELGTEVVWGTEAVAVRVHGHGAEVDVRGPGGTARTLACRWVVGCEGSHSIVRRTLGVPFEGERRENLQAVQINAEADWKYGHDRDTTRIFVEHRMCLIADPRPGGGYRFFCFLRDPDPGVTAPPGPDEMRDIVARCVHDPGLQLMPTEPPWADRARFHDRIAASLRVGRALLVGDSAHLWAPIGGHGLNTGLRGAHNLGWKLAAVHHGWARESLLDTYSAEQRRTAQEVMRDMRRNILELPAGTPTLAMMRIVGPAVLASDRMNRRGQAILSDFIRNHRTSDLSTDSGPRRGGGALRAGDRLPDLPVLQGGRRRSLHDLLSYDRWTLLVLPDDGDAVGPGLRRVVDRYAVPAEAFHVRPVPDGSAVLPGGSLLFVRPDGHVGLRAGAEDGAALDTYLGRWFTRR